MFDYFRKSVYKIQDSLKSDKNNKYTTWRTTYIYDNISLVSFYNEKYFTEVVKNVKRRFILRNIIFLIMPFMRSKKIFYSQARHIWQYGARAMLVGYLKLQTYTHKLWYLLIYDCNNVCTNGRRYFVRTVPALFVLESNSIFLLTVSCASRIFMFRNSHSIVRILESSYLNICCNYEDINPIFCL
jgi:hypothetical protein